MEQLDPCGTIYNLCRAWRLAGGLNVAALEWSLNEILRRHEVLRSTIKLADGRPLQVVQPPATFKLAVVDLHQTPEADREAEIRRRIQETAENPYDFAAGMFLRAEVLRVANDEHILVLATHHIVSDAWSMGILSRELWSLYKTYTADKSSELEELPIQYADFAVWQREWLQGTVLNSQISYWKKQLADLPILNLSTDRSRPLRQSFRGARLSITLPESLTAAINELSNECGVTPFMTLLAAFQLLLYRYTGEEDIVVGSPIANRVRPELEPLIGFLVNTLVLRTDLSGNPTFRELLSRVRAVCVDAQEHQDLPFEKLVQELQPERDQSRNPLFQVMFALQNAIRGISALEGMQIEPIEFETGRSLFDLSLYLRERDGKFIGHVEYSTDLFDSSTIQRMTGHLQTLLKAVVTDRDQGISTLPLLTEAERHQLLIEWNDTAAEYPIDKCIHTLFEEQVERTPAVIAVEFRGEPLTYGDLNQRANQLAHYLIRLGLGPETSVGVCVDRSLEMLVALLGVLKAGSAYVPLDPTYPKERLRFMLEDAQASVIVTQQKYFEGGQLSALTDQLQYVWIDRDWPAIKLESPANPHTHASSGSLAYVIYTSGSTGRPKGVNIEHRNTVNLLYWGRTVYGNEDLEGVLASTSICFDLSVFEMFVPLCWGGKIVLIDNILRLVDLANTSGITLVNTVPSAMTALLSVAALPRSVRTVNLAGEPLHRELVKRIHELGTVNKVYDLYGPSETTTYSTFTLRTPDGPNTIGRPIANTQIYILDDFLQLVPVGVPGELYIGGAGVARGCWNKTELTTEHFPKESFVDGPNARLYRTGDRARYTRTGEIEFLGRIDHQVKVRGYRLELGEIEAVLSANPGVKECAVILQQRSTVNCDGVLVAYYTAEADAPSGTELRNLLQKKLPTYMIPSEFVPVVNMPFTLNGKVDRNALRLSNIEVPKPIHADVEPRNEIEQCMLQIWRDVLQHEGVGIHDNFFDLGGHSLLSIQIISKLKECFDREVPFSALFDSPTIAELSRKIEMLLNETGVPELPPIVRASRSGPAPVSVNQEFIWQIDQMFPGTDLFNMPYVYHLSGAVDSEMLEKALKEIVVRHEALRTVFAVVDGRPVQIIKDETDFHCAHIDLHQSSKKSLSQRAAKLILEERERPFDLATGPLLRTCLLRLSVPASLLVVTVHHIISDAWSMQLFRQELTVLYEAFIVGRPSPLSNPSLQYGDYAVWERDILNSGLLDNQLSYWREQLANPHPSAIPSGRHKRITHRKVYNSQQQFELNGRRFELFKSRANNQNCTVFILFIAALKILIHYLTGKEDIRVATIVSNRRFLSCHATIGNFANTVLLRTRIRRDLSIDEAIKRVRETILAAQHNQAVPFEVLARTLPAEIVSDRNWRPRVIVMYERSTAQAPTPNAISIAPLSMQEPIQHVASTPTLYDVTFRVKEFSSNLTGSVTYSTDVFHLGVAAHVVDCLRQVMISISSISSSVAVGSLAPSIVLKPNKHV